MLALPAPRRPFEQLPSSPRKTECAPSANRAALKAHFLPVPVLSSTRSHSRFDGFGKEKIKKSF